MEKYFFQYKEIAELTIDELLLKLKVTKGLPLKDLTVKKLVFHDEKPIETAHGVYIFKDGDDFLYIGNNRGRCFVERIPAHFDVGHAGWMNSFLKQLAKKFNRTLIGTWEDNAVLQEMAKIAFENYSVILINFEWDDRVIEMGKVDTWTYIDVLEDLLQRTTNALNAFKFRETNTQQTVMHYLIKNRKEQTRKKMSKQS